MTRRPSALQPLRPAAISGGDPIKTGLQGFAYDIRTALVAVLVHLQHRTAAD
jgi:TRAP-type uncharacterized transport system fused permease subunit